jgi:ADP-glucose pyrophosphorylase
VLWDEVAVGEGARLEGCIVADGVRIPAGARYADRAIVPAPSPIDLPDGWQLDEALIVVPLGHRNPLNHTPER